MSPSCCRFSSSSLLSTYLVSRISIDHLKRIAGFLIYFLAIFQMTNSEKHDSIDGDYSHGEGFDDSSSIDDAAETSGVGEIDDFTVSGESTSWRSEEIGLTQRLTDILVDDGDGDLMIHQNDRGVRVLQWLQALDMQVIGACRSDERLKPLLKLGVSSGGGAAAEDRLVAHLSQHFEPSEAGMLARCLCIPLVSLRVGKNIKQGTRLCPTANRGNLNLMLLPTSNLRLSFTGDDGSTERLCTLSSTLQSSAVVIEEISADNSGRSFLVKNPDHRVFHFWCSEKSLLLGKELLAKMRDLLTKKPSIAELTGISETRIGCFAAHLRAYLVGSAVSKTQSCSSGSSTSSYAASTSEFSDVSENGQILIPCSKSTVRFRQNSGLSGKSNSLHQGSLVPRSSSFKEGLPRTLASLRSAVREKLRRRCDNLTIIDDVPIVPSSSTDTSIEISKAQVIAPTSFLESLGKSVAMTPVGSVPLVTPLGPSLLSPYYCWCPPIASNLQYTVAPLQLPNEPLTQPPVSSFLPATTRSSSTLLTSTSPLNLCDITSLDLPSFLPDPYLRLPFSMPSSHHMIQIPTFTPLMCDPIVHIPVIDVCSSGQGYLVSSGPAISTSIPSLHPNLANPLIQNTDSAVENGARETLRLLINGANQSNPQLMNVVFPAVLTSSNENRSLHVAGNRGLYSSTSDVDVIASSIAALGLVSLSGMTVEDSAGGRCSSSLQDDFASQLKKSNELDNFSSDMGPDSSNSS